MEIIWYASCLFKYTDVAYILNKISEHALIPYSEICGIGLEYDHICVLTSLFAIEAYGGIWGTDATLFGYGICEKKMCSHMSRQFLQQSVFPPLTEKYVGFFVNIPILVINDRETEEEEARMTTANV